MTVQTPPQPKKDAIDKCVQYVLKNGASFAEKLLASKEKAQFSFLLEDGEFHDYYSQQLQQSQQKEKQLQQSSQKDGEEAEVERASSSQVAPPKLAFLCDIPPISAHDLQIIKAVALYTACNTEQHLRKFRDQCRKSGNRKQFAFLDEGHSLHGLLRTYLEQYRLLVARARNPENNAIDKCLESQKDLFRNAYQRAAYQKRSKIKQKLQEEDEQRRQYLYASIDWQDFQLVERVHFDSIDEVSELAAPLSRSAVASRSLEMKNRFYEAVKKNQADELVNQAEELVNQAEESAKEESAKKNQAEESQKETPNFIPKGIKIKAAGESRLKKRKETERFITCPLTEQAIPESQFDAHLKVLLLDPKYKEQQENYMKKNFRYESNLTSDQVFENIKQLVRRQTDERPVKRTK